MSRDEIQKLLGGYATGTLTTPEQQALFEAALEDQQLFDQLAQEQALRDLLHEPNAKAQVLQALDQPRRSWFALPRVWWPAAATAAVACAALVLVFAVKRNSPQPVTMATYKAQEEIRPVPASPPPPPTPTATPAGPPAKQPASTEPATTGDKGVEAVSPAKPRAFAAETRDSRSLDGARREDADEKLKKETSSNAAAAPAAPAPAVGFVAGSGAAPPPELKDTAPSAANTIQVNERDQTVQVNNAPPQTAQALFYNNAQVVTAFKAAEQSAGVPQQQQEPAAQQQQAVQVQALRARQLAQARDAMVFPGFKYRILREFQGGRFAEAPADALTAADKLRVEFTMNVSGRLDVKAGGETLIERRVVAQGAYRTDQLTPGITELTVDFTPDPLPKVAMARLAQGGGGGKAVNVVERKPEETYVVGVPPTDRVHFTIQLKYR
jgi:hypothetical protein